MAVRRMLWLPEALGRFGVRYVELDGWRTRERPGTLFEPSAHLQHHTVGPLSGVAPSLNVCMYGRPGVEGPLCQILQGRDDVARLISAGRANHAGLGSGLVGYGVPADRGGWHLSGLEIEHTGTDAEPWTASRVDTAARIGAAILWGLATYHGVDPWGGPGGLPRVWAHKEYAPDRKIDPWRWIMSQHRQLVASYLLAGGAGKPDLEDVVTPEDRQSIVDAVVARLGPQLQQAAAAAATAAVEAGRGAWQAEVAAQRAGTVLALQDAHSREHGAQLATLLAGSDELGREVRQIAARAVRATSATYDTPPDVPDYAGLARQADTYAELVGAVHLGSGTAVDVDTSQLAAAAEEGAARGVRNAMPAGGSFVLQP